MATNNIALITGASSGIGEVYADRLSKMGYDLILVARNADKLKRVADKIQNASGVNVHVVIADLSIKSELLKIESLIKENKAINLLVNNAGFGAVTPLLKSNADLMEDMININVTALTRLTYAAAPEFINRENGTIINIASIVAIGPEILNGVYGATKAYVLALTQSLQHELGQQGLRVQAVLPGATATEFWDVAGMPHSNLPSEIVMSTADMVDAALKGLALGDIVTIPPLQDLSDWSHYESARKSLSQKFGNSKPSARYA